MKAIYKKIQIKCEYNANPMICVRGMPLKLRTKLEIPFPISNFWSDADVKLIFHKDWFIRYNVLEFELGSSPMIFDIVYTSWTKKKINNFQGFILQSNNCYT